MTAALDRPTLRAVLERWAERQWLRRLDAVFADFLWREVPTASPLAILAAALASHQLGRGHVCLDLEATLRTPAFALSLPPDGLAWADSQGPLPVPAELLRGLTAARWRQALREPLLVEEVGEERKGDGGIDGSAPLVLVGTRLYLRRYWRYEQAVRAGIARRLTAPPDPVPPAALRGPLDALFPASPGDAPDWQKIACGLAARSAFSIVTGGPGSGKTTTVVRLLALLQALALTPSTTGAPPGAPPPSRESRALRIRLAAPTGKAAARLNESIAGAVARLPLAGLADADAVRQAIPLTVHTLHRLLGSRPDSRRFRHHAGNPLAVDVLVIDEASMIDLEMMAAVLAALPTAARLVLLGDQDQLASVEAGAVLGELSARARQGHYTPATADWLAAATGERLPPPLIDPAGRPLDQAVAMLRHGHRFAADSGIGQLAEAVNAGDAAGANALWSRGHADLALLSLGREGESGLERLLVDGGPAAVPARGGYRHYLECLRDERPTHAAGAAAFDDWARAVLRAHGQFQVLCALRRGPWGVEGLNARIAHLLRAAGLIPANDGWYPGRPVLVTRNDYQLGLMNGDIGITLALPAASGEGWLPRVAFPAGDAGQGIKWVLPSRLQSVETAYALTVHKAQGSEFSHAALILPETLGPLLTRELLYTGITRARAFLTVAMPGPPRLFDDAIRRRVLRASGLSAGEGE
ncbi:MAG TPA: exodeoxyribonuclease V subunit alpha [Accumulibacter sp.]|nr:exodeoxyribonuclease V subunit alpha [Accumulibacter sp.]HQC80398.1 exodeoxyribonuclease V subunit alpha [Accumulibacter sp.]